MYNRSKILKKWIQIQILLFIWWIPEYDKSFTFVLLFSVMMIVEKKPCKKCS